MKIKVKKLFNNKVSVRDYVVRSLINKHEDLVIAFNGEKMSIKSIDLKLGKTDYFVHKSKYDGKEYRLIDYEWKPDNDSQSKLI